jgi:hypothetical protein
MARKVIVTTEILDDFDPTVEADDTVEFIHDGVKYTVDCSNERAQEFRDYLQLFKDVAHEKVKIPKGALQPKGQQALPAGQSQGALEKKASSPPGETTEDRNVIRDWARANGFEVQSRGLIRQEIRDAYTAATGIEVGANVYVGESRSSVKRYEAMGVHQQQPELPMPPDQPPTHRAEPGRANAHGITPEMRAWARDRGFLTKGSYISREHRDQFHAEHAEKNGVLV